ncbi:MAG: aminotransferase class III-fold pyridoxal phosphate-dependent enzyme [Anaerolineae bacterium]
MREITRRRDIVLIFDEVITGFRHALGGYQAICGVTPDLTTLAKAMANGYPIAAVAGRADLLDHYTTAGGDVYFAGTYNGHPVSAAAALATIAALADGSAHAHMAALGEALRRGLADIIERAGLRATVAGYGSIWVVYFMDGPITTYADLLRNDTARFIAFRRETTRRGAFQLPLNLKRSHISAAHSEADIAATLQIAEDVLRDMARVGERVGREGRETRVCQRETSSSAVQRGEAIVLALEMALQRLPARGGVPTPPPAECVTTTRILHADTTV